MDNKRVKGWYNNNNLFTRVNVEEHEVLFQNTNIDKLYGEFRKVANVLFLKRKTSAKENYLAQEPPKCSSTPINIYLFIVWTAF